MILIGTKYDLKEEFEERGIRSVSKQDGQKLAKQIGALGYFETSAKTGKGVNEAIDAILESALESNREHNPPPIEKNTCCTTKCYLASCLVNCCQCFKKDSQ